ncbi:MAG: hydroxyethylthiazole kinase [Clostridia bacterium]|nr:hydroxyethylthiazole kinase [Clostridia bacterium]
MLKEAFENVKTKKPVVHCITNFVTATDCANTLLSCGASPVMADEPKEARDVTSLSDALEINIGTLQKRRVRAMLKAGKTAKKQGKPIVLDPVGAGASRFREKTAKKLLKKLSPHIVKGNVSEIKALFEGEKDSRGVDAALGERDIKSDTALAEKAAREHDCIVIITGKTDIVTDGKRTYCVYNGHPLMQSVTGMGCRLSALLAAFAAAGEGDALVSALSAVCLMGVCGEKAFERMKDADGSGSFSVYFTDALFGLSGEELEARARFEEKKI